MFFTVKHGADQHELFNSDCGLHLLIDSMIKRCNFPPDAAIGLIDEKCNVMNLLEQNSDLTSCASLFDERGVYTLIAIYRNESGDYKYKALLDSVDPDLALRLESLSNPQSALESKLSMKSKAKSKATLTTTIRNRRNSATVRPGRSK